MPGNLKDVSCRDFADALFGRLAAMFREVRPADPTADSVGMTTLASGISMEKTLESLRGPVVLTMSDFVNVPRLTPVQNLGTLQEVEASLAKDIKRRGG